ncbi:MAG: MFS transporter [Bacillota bacterium]|nr:MFS transporter [Bacillota bacterium]
MDSKQTVAVAPHKRLGKKRWTIVIWLIVGGLINYIDRSNLSLAAPSMMADLHLNNTDIGLMGTVFSWTYAFMQLPSGWLIDKFGAKRMYAIAIFFWSLATAATGMMHHLWSLLTGRAALGVTEAPCWPSGAKITADWFPKKERAFATGMWDSSSKLGPTIAPPIIVALLVPLGWRNLFFITGITGVIFAILFHFFYKNPKNDKNLSADEYEYITQEDEKEEQEADNEKISWGALFKYRSIWGMIFGFFCYIWIFNIFVYFLPLYLTHAFHVTTASLGFYASVPWIGGIIGAIGGGWISKKLVDIRHVTPFFAKRIMIVICSIAGGVLVLSVPFTHSIAATMIIMTLALCFLSSVSANAWALPGDVAPDKLVASVGSIQNFGGYFGGALSPVVTGLIVDVTGSYNLAFVSGGIIAAAAALCYWFIVRHPIQKTA